MRMKGMASFVIITIFLMAMALEAICIPASTSADGGLSAVGNQRWSQNSGGIAGTAEAFDRFGFSLCSGDFDNDGNADLVIGVPFEDGSTEQNTGMITVVYGTLNTGLTSTGSASWNQGDLTGYTEDGDLFGFAVCSGNFNGDVYADLAIGVPGEAPGLSSSTWEAGCVNVMYGGSSGLSTSGDQAFNQSDEGMWDGAERYDHFGSALCSGDFDGNGTDDLAIGVPDEDTDSAIDAGIVNVVYGDEGGLGSMIRAWRREHLGIGETDLDGIRFGAALCSGDFDNDGYADMAIGAPGALGAGLGGSVFIMFGRQGGMQPVGTQRWEKESDEVDPDGVRWFRFGSSLAAGDFNGDGYADLAIGADEATVRGSVAHAGAVCVAYGKADRDLIWDGSQVWKKDVLLGQPVEYEYFGAALCTGDFNNDGYDDLSIGAPGLATHGIESMNKGSVSVLYGSADGLSATATATTPANQLWDPSLVPEWRAEGLGVALSAGNFNGVEGDDLALSCDDIRGFIRQQIGGGFVGVLHGSE